VLLPERDRSFSARLNGAKHAEAEAGAGWDWVGQDPADTYTMQDITRIRKKSGASWFSSCWFTAEEFNIELHWSTVKSFLILLSIKGTVQQIYQRSKVVSIDRSSVNIELLIFFFLT
jgi:hypothetical protein